MTGHLHRGRRLGLVVMLGALATFAVFGGTGLAGSSAKPSKAQYAPGQYKNANKVTLCHKAKVTIRVSVNALRAHEAHGDVVGTCSVAGSAAKAKQAKQAKLKQAKAKAKAHADESTPDETDATETGGPPDGHGQGNGQGNGKSQGNGKGNGKS